MSNIPALSLRPRETSARNRLTTDAVTAARLVSQTLCSSVSSSSPQLFVSDKELQRTQDYISSSMPCKWTVPEPLSWVPLKCIVWVANILHQHVQHRSQFIHDELETLRDIVAVIQQCQHATKLAEFISNWRPTIVPKCTSPKDWPVNGLLYIVDNLVCLVGMLCQNQHHPGTDSATQALAAPIMDLVPFLCAKAPIGSAAVAMDVEDEKTDAKGDIKASTDDIKLGAAMEVGNSQLISRRRRFVCPYVFMI